MDFSSNPLFKRLQQAIAEGLPDEAAEIAAGMAQMCAIANGREMRGEKRLPQPRKQMAKNTGSSEFLLRVGVEKSDGTTDEFQISVPLNCTMKMLKEKVQNDIGYNVNCQCWFFNDDNVKDDNRTVRKLNSLTPVLYIRAERPHKYKNAGKALGIVDKKKANARTYEKPKEMVKENAEAIEGWKCSKCTFINQPTRPGCEVCTNARPDDYVVKPELEDEYLKLGEEAEKAFLEKYEREQRENFEKYVELDARKLVANNETFECMVCYTEVEPGEGVQLHECLHTFCRTCIYGTIVNSEDIPVKCPYADDDYNCECVLQDREIANILSEEDLQKYQSRCWAQAAVVTQNSFFCKTPDCKGFCEYEEGVQEFPCPICKQTSCIPCQAIHAGENCQTYQDGLKLNTQNNEDVRKTQEQLEELVRDGTAMHCPGCGVVIEKTIGCDGMQCTQCKIEICWATKGPRWGPGGRGDTSGGCRCRASPDRIPCHPKCGNCH